MNEIPPATTQDPGDELSTVHNLAPALALLDPAMLGSSEGRHDLLQSTTPLEFVSWVKGLNAASRGLAPEEGEITTGLAVVSSTSPDTQAGVPEQFYIAPSTEMLKMAVLAKAFNAARIMDDDRAVGTLLGVANTVAHINDGTGRTSRLLYSMFAEGYDGSDEAQQHLSRLLQQGNRAVIDMSPERAGLPKTFAAHDSAISAARSGFTAEEAQVIKLENLPLAHLLSEVGATDLAALVVNEPFFGLPTVLEWAKTSQRDMGAFMVEGQNGHIDASKVAQAMAHDGAVNILNVRDAVNMRYADSIVRCLAKGDESIYGQGSRERIIDAYDPRPRYMALGYAAVEAP